VDVLDVARLADQSQGRVRLLAPGWLDVFDPQPSDLARLQRAFGFHPLALEDVAQQHQRPKIDEYQGHYFCVIYAARVDLARHRLGASELQFFWSRDTLVTVHVGPMPEIDAVAQRLRSNSLVRLGGGAELRAVDFAYHVLDEVVDGYFPLVDAVAEWSEAMEEEMFSGQHDRDTLQSLFELKKDVARIRTRIAPGRDVLNVVLRRDQPLFDAELTPYFQDLYDRCLRATDSLDTYREVLAAALETYLSVVSNDVNQTVKRMTAVSAILMADALVTGVYGMNFDRMPELHWALGYPYALGLMVAVSLVLWLLFRRIRWL
jgi:magnesium transporter